MAGGTTEEAWCGGDGFVGIMALSADFIVSYYLHLFRQFITLFHKKIQLMFASFYIPLFDVLRHNCFEKNA